MYNQSFDNSKYIGAPQQPQEEIDPSLEDYFVEVANMIFPLEVREQRIGNPLSEVGITQILRIRVMTGKQANYEEVKIELTSEDDLFFNYIRVIDRKQFSRLKKEQNLTIEFQNFIPMIVKLVNKMQTDKNGFFAVMAIRKDKTAHLDFVESVGYKTIEILSLEIDRVSHELNRDIVTYRFNVVKRRLHLLNSSLKQVHGVLKVKNPSLYQKLNKKNPHTST